MERHEMEAMVERMTGRSFKDIEQEALDMTLEQRLELLESHVVNLLLKSAQQEKINELQTRLLGKLTFKMMGIDPALFDETDVNSVHNQFPGL